MVGTGPVLAYGKTVLPGRIAPVTVPAINGIFPVKILHVLIPVGFGQDGGGCNGHVYPISFNNAVIGDIPPRPEPVSVHKDVFRER